MYHQLTVYRYQDQATLLNAIARPILGDMDKVWSEATSGLSDMGIPKEVIAKLKKIVKRRL
jgi:hypothetical protein